MQQAFDVLSWHKWKIKQTVVKLFKQADIYESQKKSRHFYEATQKYKNSFPVW